VKLLNRLMV